MDQAEQEPLQLMDHNTGNFLAIAFEIERLLKVSATVIMGNEKIPKNPDKLPLLLKEKGLLTENGIKQLQGIHWLRDIIVQGRSSEISEGIISSGTNLAWSFYNELNDWLKKPSS